MREARLPTITCPRQIPIKVEPADVTTIVENYGIWLSQSAIPKLLILGNPGAIITGRTPDFCPSWRSQREVIVPWRHLLQEDSPDQITLPPPHSVKPPTPPAQPSHPPHPLTAPLMRH